MFSFFTEFRTAQKVSSQKFHVIFYAESRYYFQYFRHLLEELVLVPNIRIAYITSDKNDPVLNDSRIATFYLKTTLAGIFPRLRADVMIMTMPDLQNFIFKKSPEVKKYIYVFHALVSTHQQYRNHAFDHYDAIFCTGPQQEKEIRESESRYQLPAKEIIHYGYPLLQALKEKKEQASVRENKILIAPSWYQQGILNTCILEVVTELLKTGYEVWIRPHPEFIKRNKQTYQQLVRQMQQNGAIHFDTTPTVYTHLLDAAFLITDRSGIALEYAFATKRPVLFIDTPLKIQNPEVDKWTLTPLENRYRGYLGASVKPGELNGLGPQLRQLKSAIADYSASIEKAEKEVVFPPDHWSNGTGYITRHLHF